MRKFAVTLAATAAFVSMGLAAGSAEAAMLSGSQGLRVAAEAGDMIDRVHCRPVGRITGLGRLMGASIAVTDQSL